MNDKYGFMMASGYGLDDIDLGAATPVPSTPTDYFEIAQKIAPIAQSFFPEEDAREEEAVLRAKIKNYKKMRGVFPYSVVPGVLWYDNEIAKMKARLKVVHVQAEEKREDVDEGRQWREMGQLALGVGIVTGFAIIG
ncbi:MAG: hypothetical protein Q8Q85_09805, partial [Gemmatimonadales bacterium]|nr:hypothetical protein [Gemmatimonadales bacterium]